MLDPREVAESMHDRAIDAMREADDLYNSGQREKAIDRYAELTLGSSRHTPIVALKSNTMLAQLWSSRNDAKEAKAYVIGAEIRYSTCKITRDLGMPDYEAKAIMKDMRGVLDGLATSSSKAEKDKEASGKDVRASEVGRWWKQQCLKIRCCASWHGCSPRR